MCDCKCDNLDYQKICEENIDVIRKDGMYISNFGMCKKCGITSIVISKDLIVSSYKEYRGINGVGKILESGGIYTLVQ